MKLIKTLLIISISTLSYANDNLTTNSDINPSLEIITKYIESERAAAEEKRVNGHKAFVTAEKLVSQGDIKSASFYYAIAVSSDYTNAQYIESYTNALMAWADTMMSSGKHTAAISALQNMLAYLNMQGISVAIYHPNVVAKLINDVDSKLTSAQNIITTQSYNSIKANENDTVHTISGLLSQQIPEDIIELNSYRQSLETYLANVINLNVENKEQLISATYDRLNAVLVAIEVEQYLTKGNELIDLVITIPEAPFASQTMTEASIIGQRLLQLSEQATDIQKVEIKHYTEKFSEVFSQVAKSVSAKEFNKMQTKYASLKTRITTPNIKATQAISQLSDMHEDIIVDSAKVTDTEYVKEIRKLLKIIVADIEYWQTVRQKYYEDWAIKSVKRFHEIYQGEPGLLGSGEDVKGKIYDGLVDYLCPIDLTYLGIDASRLYSDVFDLYYNELDRDMKFEISAQFTECKKRDIDEF